MVHPPKLWRMPISYGSSRLGRESQPDEVLRAELDRYDEALDADLRAGRHDLVS